MPTTTRAGALAALAALLVAGCSGLDAQTTDALTMAPGTTAHALVNVTAESAAEAWTLQVEDDAGLMVDLPDGLHGDGSGQAAGWVGIEVPGDATPGEREIVLTVEGGDEAITVQIPVTVESPADPLGQGAVAVVDLTFHTRDGTVAMTTRDDVDGSPLPKTDDYQPPQGGPQDIPVSPQQLPAEIVGPLAQAAVGHTFTAEMPEFYGPEDMEQEQPREETVARSETRERYVEMPRAQAEQGGYVTADTQEGDPWAVGGPIPYVVETLNETTFRAEVDVEEGDIVALHAAWPHATTVAAVEPGTVVLQTDPPVEEGEDFTWNPSWTNATRIVQIDDETITLRHTPAEGLQYTQQTRQGPVTTTVVAVGDETITVSQENPHPLAGQTILIEITVTDERDAPQQPQMPVG